MQTPDLTATRAAAAVAVALLLGTTGAVSAAAGGPARAAGAPSAAQRTIAAQRLTVGPGTVRPGTVVPARDLSSRTYVDPRHGFALADYGQATYPAASTNGGRTWHTSGPALVVHAAQAPLEVEELTAINTSRYFATGNSQAVDATADGGRNWYRTVFPGELIAVVWRATGLTAVVAGGTGATPTNWVYVSTDGGRRWRYRAGT
ncbi:MAG TPA: hypothetical protein VNV42_13395 [Solirubrobacteraceae bacterium]|nr:hypothetical protein [Solirubrobacteraceae bacterium]